MTITIEPTPEEEQQLTKLANDAGMTVEELAHNALMLRIEHSSDDDEFRAATEHVLSKNRELYKRLAQ